MSAPRPAVPSDVPELLRLIVELAVYEKEPDAVRTTEADDGEEPGVLTRGSE